VEDAPVVADRNLVTPLCLDAPPPAAKVETAVPANAVTVTDWYKQDVYDPNDKKMGQIKDCWSTSPARSTRWSSASAASKRLTD